MAENKFNGEIIRKELQENGVCVVPGVLTEEECDELIASFRLWLKQFKDEDWPFHMNSVIQQYYIGHFKATWTARLKSKDVFKEVWQTNKLLTSFDGVAISPPPELGGSAYAVADAHWFHLDQGAIRQGLHAYQGAVYLEETTESDYVFRVLEGSHKLHKQFFEKFSKAARKASRHDFYKLTPVEYEWYMEHGCVQRTIPVPKGGMVLWDSRTIHDNNKPQFGRPNSDRWRFVVFSCMTPAIWARAADIAKKRTAYKKMLMTSHWPSQEVDYFDDFMPTHEDKIHTIKALPDIAKTQEVQQLSGVLEYDFEDDQSNGPEAPTWITFEQIGLDPNENGDDEEYPTDGSVPAWQKKK
ncbi:hypothetical protein SNE40_014096 [Patella caerulea]|uniref:Phytanoyl-CoA dioxygenase n=1 Tax=Patella caerulea TaxID=87958 RepID=A0AAN8PS44_PATCE